jgi:hypothetical protein
MKKLLAAKKHLRECSAYVLQIRLRALNVFHILMK